MKRVSFTLTSADVYKEKRFLQFLSIRELNLG